MHTHLNNDKCEINSFFENLGINAPTKSQQQFAFEAINGMPLYQHFESKELNKALGASSVFIRIIARNIDSNTHSKSVSTKGADSCLS